MNFIGLPPRRGCPWWAPYECVGAAPANATSARLKIEIGPVGVGDEVDVLAVALDPVVDEGAEGEDREAALAGLVEGEAGEPAADPMALEAFLDLGVDQRQETLLLAVEERAREL